MPILVTLVEFKQQAMPAENTERIFYPSSSPLVASYNSFAKHPLSQFGTATNVFFASFPTEHSVIIHQYLIKDINNDKAHYSQNTHKCALIFMSPMLIQLHPAGLLGCEAEGEFAKSFSRRLPVIAGTSNCLMLVSLGISAHYPRKFCGTSRHDYFLQIWLEPPQYFELTFYILMQIKSILFI